MFQKRLQHSFQQLGEFGKSLIHSYKLLRCPIRSSPLARLRSVFRSMTCKKAGFVIRQLPKISDRKPRVQLPTSDTFDPDNCSGVLPINITSLPPDAEPSKGSGDKASRTNNNA
ncbi:unnamed protein product [Lepeophtheirus salmonis]|uniref:(salmon louse) hypothetical protein n=1 Tax=Lepeophtheirus salmonis TaxID=72036 RepID=A0A7R8H818_LEPSM|nr:unnamed protein product [Lepeophtheirus salmonis]CAF2914511.1 unnamed protein product [Lepeophtheirus salmonis]